MSKNVIDDFLARGLAAQKEADKLLSDGQNALSGYGAATTMGRNKNILQIVIAFGNEDEAKAVIDRIMADIRLRGKTVLVLGGTVDEQASAGVKQ